METGYFKRTWTWNQGIQETIAKIDPLPGAKEFLDELRSFKSGNSDQ